MLIVVFILLYIYSVFGNRENLCGQLMIYTMKIFESKSSTNLFQK